MAQWLRRPPVETLVVTGSDPGLAKNLFLHFFLTKMNTVDNQFSLKLKRKIEVCWRAGGTPAEIST